MELQTPTKIDQLNADRALTDVLGQPALTVGRHVVEVDGHRWTVVIAAAAVDKSGCGNTNLMIAPEGVVVQSP
jgi:hypothetical protein